MTPLDALRRRFESSFGFSLPAEIEGVETLRPVDERGLLLGSAAAGARVYLTQGDVGDFVAGAPDGYARATTVSRPGRAPCASARAPSSAIRASTPT
jgi:hypothetical protein